MGKQAGDLLVWLEKYGDIYDLMHDGELSMEQE